MISSSDMSDLDNIFNDSARNVEEIEEYGTDDTIPNEPLQKSSAPKKVTGEMTKIKTIGLESIISSKDDNVSQNSIKTRRNQPKRGVKTQSQVKVDGKRPKRIKYVSSSSSEDELATLTQVQQKLNNSKKELGNVNANTCIVPSSRAKSVKKDISNNKRGKEEDIFSKIKSPKKGTSNGKKEKDLNKKPTNTIEKQIKRRKKTDKNDGETFSCVSAKLISLTNIQIENTPLIIPRSEDTNIEILSLETNNTERLTKEVKRELLGDYLSDDKPSLQKTKKRNLKKIQNRPDFVITLDDDDGPSVPKKRQLSEIVKHENDYDLILSSDDEGPCLPKQRQLSRNVKKENCEVKIESETKIVSLAKEKSSKSTSCNNSGMETCLLDDDVQFVANSINNNILKSNNIIKLGQVRVVYIDKSALIISTNPSTSKNDENSNVLSIHADETIILEDLKDSSSETQQLLNSQLHPATIFHENKPIILMQPSSPKNKDFSKVHSINEDVIVIQEDSNDSLDNKPQVENAICKNLSKNKKVTISQTTADIISLVEDESNDSLPKTQTSFNDNLKTVLESPIIQNNQQSSISTKEKLSTFDHNKQHLMKRHKKELLESSANDNNCQDIDIKPGTSFHFAPTSGFNKIIPPFETIPSTSCKNPSIQEAQKIEKIHENNEQIISTEPSTFKTVENSFVLSVHAYETIKQEDLQDSSNNTHQLEPATICHENKPITLFQPSSPKNEAFSMVQSINKDVIVIQEDSNDSFANKPQVENSICKNFSKNKDVTFIQSTADIVSLLDDESNDFPPKTHTSNDNLKTTPQSPIIQNNHQSSISTKDQFSNFDHNKTHLTKPYKLELLESSAINNYQDIDKKPGASFDFAPTSSFNNINPPLHPLPIKQLTNFDFEAIPSTSTSRHEASSKNPRIKANLEPLWKEHELIEEEHNIAPAIAKNIVDLFKDGNTIPFIARYRREAVGQMSADELRNIRNTYENTLELKQKVVTAYGKIQNLGKMNDELERALLGVRNLDTLDELYAPFKQEGESIKKAIHAALDEAANMILKGNSNIDLVNLIGKAKGLDNMEIVWKELIQVIAKKISMTPHCLEFLNKIKSRINCYLETKKINKRKTIKNEKVGFKMMSKMDGSKYEQYYDQKYNTKSLQPHQILAINRAEQAKFLHVYLHFHDYSQQFIYESWQIWSCMRRSKFRDLFNEVLVECYENILMPLLKRTKRSELKSYAEKASLKVFSQNLKQILLAAPVKGKRILGVDPGFTHGCKLGVISETGSVLATSVVFPHIGNARKIEVHEKVFRDLLIEHNCSLIALGNGTACRETEAWITDMIARGMFQPLDVSYTIVNESGASIYSCSKEAVKEFPDLDPNKISAVSLARRVQDPLSELVKVEPKHLGIGMYQHDVNRKRLEEALTDVVSECVSFVGVDLNTASQCLLKYVAGLTEKRAADVIAFRKANGAFSTREQLLKVRGIGSHSFKQCAGFLNIFNGENKLEVTSVHPESYDIAKKLVKHLNLRLNDVGTEAFAQIIRNEQPKLLDSYKSLGTSQQVLETVLESLSEPTNYDLRDKVDKRPLFRSETTRIESLQEGMKVTGRVENVTSFGSFVDIGVGTNGLLHIKQSNGMNLQIGDHIEVLINRVDLDRMRVSLKLCQKF